MIHGYLANCTPRCCQTRSVSSGSGNSGHSLKPRFLSSCFPFGLTCTHVLTARDKLTHYTRARARTHTHPPPHTHSHVRTNTHTHTETHTHTHTHTHTLSLSLRLSLTDPMSCKKWKVEKEAQTGLCQRSTYTF